MGNVQIRPYVRLLGLAARLGKIRWRVAPDDPAPSLKHGDGPAASEGEHGVQRTASLSWLWAMVYCIGNENAKVLHAPHAQRHLRPELQQPQSNRRAAIARRSLACSKCSPHKMNSGR